MRREGEEEKLLPPFIGENTGQHDTTTRGRRTAFVISISTFLVFFFFAISNSWWRDSTSTRIMEAIATEQKYATPSMSAGQDPNACILTSNPVLNGYDVVAYFSLKPDGEAVLGSSLYQTTYNEKYSFYFSSEKNLKLFEKEPLRYLPQWGGFCAFGISSEDFWSWEQIQESGPEANPSSWLISSEKLYVFMYDVPKRKFLQANYAEKIKEGEERWFNFTSGNIHDYFNTGCFWDDLECGRDGDECVGEAASNGVISNPAAKSSDGQ